MSKAAPDVSVWSEIQSPRELDVARRFEYDEDLLGMMHEWLHLGEQKHMVAEVGSGSGYFTEKLVKMCSPDSEIICIEPDNALRTYAFGKLNLRFLSGRAEEPPLTDFSADLTACHILLNVLKGPRKAIAEMTGVTMRGAMVAAIEPALGGEHFFPDPELNKLAKMAQNHLDKGVWKLRKLAGCENAKSSTRLTYPSMFRECGLENVEAHGLLSVFLLNDYRRNDDELLQWLRERLDVFLENRERDAYYMKEGEFNSRLIVKFQKSFEQYLRNLLETPSQIRNTPEQRIVSRTVTIGRKL